MPGEIRRISWGIYYVAYIFMDLRSVAFDHAPAHYQHGSHAVVLLLCFRRVPVVVECQAEVVADDAAVPVT
jgi:hypothetical protein